jgi:membrane-associated protease RseP (regulator of RpoE activity)
MTVDQQRRTVHQLMAELLGLEAAIERSLAGQRETVRSYPEAQAAIERARDKAERQYEALRSRLQRDGGEVAVADHGAGGLASLLGVVEPSNATGGLFVSTILWHHYTAFQHMVMGYGMLWCVSHRAYDVRQDEPIFRLAEAHQRAYAEAAQEIVRLHADVLAWELSEEGQPCRCLCPTCSGIGICLCIGGGRSLTVGALNETANSEERGVLVRQLRKGDLADRAGMRQGDVIVAVDGQEVPTVWELTPLLEPFQAGEPIKVQVEREGGARAEITIQRG